MADIATWMTQAIAALEAGRTALAQDRLRRVLAVAPDHAEAIGMMVDIHREADELAEASELLTEALKREPEAIGFSLALADLQLAQGRPGPAAQILKAALLLSPGNWEALHLLGNAFSDVSAWAEAAKCYRLSIESNPYEADTWYNLGVALANAKAGAREQREAWQTFLMLDPDSEQRPQLELEIARLAADEA